MKNSTSRIKYIVLHYTASKSDYSGAAYDNTVYFKNTYRGASAHYFVDMSDTVYRCVKDSDIAWHCGEGIQTNYGHDFYKKCTNANSIGIEMVSYMENNEYKVSRKTLENTRILVRQLMKKYSVSPECIITHFDVTGKFCPAFFIDKSGRKNSMYFDFIKSLEEDEMEKFKDIDNHWAKEYIEKLLDYGIVSGDGYGNFRPDDKITRAECAKIVSNALLITGK